MRVKLIIENDTRLKKRKLCYLVDEETCSKVADLCFLIKNRFFGASVKGKISLFLDGFYIPAQEDINIIKENDIITVRNISSATPTSESSSSSGSDKDIKMTAQQSKKNHPMPQELPLSSNIKPLPIKIPLKEVSKKSIKSSNKTVTSDASSSGTSDSSSSSSESEAVPNKKKKISTMQNVAVAKNVKNETYTKTKQPVSSSSKTNGKIIPVSKASKVSLGSSNVTVSKKVTSKPTVGKTIAISKLGVSNIKKADSYTSSSSTSDSSSSSSEDYSVSVTKKKRCVMPSVSVAKNKKEVTHTKAKAKQGVTSSSVINLINEKNKPEVTHTEVKQGFNNLINGKIIPAVGNIKNITTSKKSKKSSSSSDSSACNDLSVNSPCKKEENKKLLNVDFHVSKFMESNSKHLSSTPSAETTVTNTPSTGNTSGNISSRLNSKSKENKIVCHDVYKNQSQFFISKLISNGNSNEDIIDDVKTNDSAVLCNQNTNIMNPSKGSQNAAGISGRVKRNRRRRQRKQEIFKNQKASVMTNDTVDGEKKKYNIKITDESVAGDANFIFTATKNDSMIDSVASTSLTIPKPMEMEPPPKDYDSYAQLAEPPSVGNIIAYKILEMSPTCYTPEISAYKEASVKNFDKETNILELSPFDIPIKKTGDIADGSRKGRFEMPIVDEEDYIQLEPQDTIFASWNELIDPRLICLEKA